MLKKGDIILLIFLLVISVLVYIGYFTYKSGRDDYAKVAIISHEGKVIRKVDLDSVAEPIMFDIEGEYKNTILIEKGRIRVLESNCPDRVCVNTSWLDKIGDLAVCIPNRFIIKIEGEPEKVDGVTY